MHQSDRPNTHHWPPILYVAVLAAAAVLHWLVPLPAAGGTATRWVGALLLVAGIGVAVAGLQRFHAHGTTFDPTGPAHALATDGVYRLTRNPMYLGALLAYVGLGLAVRWTWLIVLVPAMAIGLARLAVVREEAYLERRFGDDYRRYRERVRRWL